MFTQPASTPPLIVNTKYWVNGTTLTYKLGITPSNQDSVIAIFNNQKLSSGSYTIDYTNNTFTFNSNNPGTGWLVLTSMQIGTLQLLDSYAKTITTTGTTYLSSIAYADIGSNGTSTYVTVNGIPAVQGVDYTLTKYRSRARFTFNTIGAVQAYLFNGPVKSFSEINEQVIVASATTTTFDLIQPPGNVGPFHSQVIVTKSPSFARLTPPITTYYAVTDGQLIFDISESITYPPRIIELRNLEVYVNGQLSPVPGIWRFNQQAEQIQFAAGTVSDGDVIAIVVKVGNEYLIENNQLVLSAPVAPGDALHITTFTNHDPDFIRTARFSGHRGNQYTLQRPVLDSAYVWVTYNGQPLTVDLDYSVTADGHTVIIRDAIYQSSADVVVITSFADTKDRLTGYRIFHDMLGRTHYKRLSSENTTVLAQDLLMTDETILVQDSSVLTPPVVSANRPGVILINSERIEFFTISGNTLGQLRRGTLGTMPKDVFVAGTGVVDQGALQTVPFTEFTQSTATVITTSTQVNFNLSGWIQFNTSTIYTDQVEVRYGGALLLKPSMSTTYVSHDFNAAYDSTSTADAIIAPQFTIASTSSVLTLNFTPQPGVKLEVIARNSRTFGDANSPVIKFLTGKPASLEWL